MLRHTDRHSLSLTERPSAVPKWQFNFIHDDLMRCIECASLCWQFQFFFHLLSCMWFCLFSDDKRTKQIRSVHWSLSQMVCGKRERRIKKKTLSHFILMPFWLVLVCVSLCRRSCDWHVTRIYLRMRSISRIIISSSVTARFVIIF